MNGSVAVIGAGVCMAAAIVTALLAGIVALRDRRSFANRCFIALLALLAAAELLRAMSLRAITPEDAIFWQKLRMACSALLPGTGLLFSLSFARASYERYLARWKFVVAGLFAAPVITVALFSGSFFGELSLEHFQAQNALPLGTPAK